MNLLVGERRRGHTRKSLHRKTNQMRTKIESFFVFLSAILFAHTCSAAQVEKLYYVGESKLSDASGRVYGSQVILLEKVVTVGCFFLFCLLLLAWSGRWPGIYFILF